MSLMDFFLGFSAGIAFLAIILLFKSTLFSKINFFKRTGLNTVKNKQNLTKINKRLLEAQLKKKEFEALYKASTCIPGSNTFKIAARKIYNYYKELIGARSGFLILFSPESKNNELLFYDIDGDITDSNAKESIPVKGLIKKVREEKLVVFDNNLIEKNQSMLLPFLNTQFGNLLAAPVISENKIVGSVVLVDKEGGFTKLDTSLASNFGELFSIAYTFLSYLEDLRKSKERIYLAMKATNYGMYDWNIVTNEIYYSPALKNMLGYKYHELENKFSVWKQLTHPEDVERTVKVVNKKIKDKEERFEFESRMKHKNGHWINVLSRGLLIYNKDGEIERLLGTHIDLTEHKETEELLRHERDLFQQLLDYFPDSIYFKDNKAKFVRVSKSMARLFNKPLKEIIGKTDLDFFEAEIGRLKYEDDLKVINTGIPKLDYEELDNTREGLKRWVQSSKLPWLDKNGNIQGIFGISRDITVQKQTKEELRRAKERAEASDRLKTEFLNNMSHEVRTPLNGILGFSKFLNKPNLTEEKRKNYINIIHSSGNQLLRIIDDILEISSLETKQVRAKFDRVNLNNLLFELFSIFEIKAKEKDLHLYLRKELSDKDSEVYTDELRLKKILSNLIENALKFTNKGHVEIGYHLKHGDIEIYVKDTGIGIKPENQDIIFERFSQEEKELSQKTGGLGLGLSIAKENTELLRGKIYLDSEKGKGTTFYVSIPFKPVYTDKITNDMEGGQDKEKTKSDKKTILIVEDEEVNVIYIETILETEMELNYQLLYAKNGLEAVEICKSNPEIDLVLMDIKMPVMNGYEATEKIREFRPELTIIAQTAYSTPKDKEKAFDAGCNEFISKPLDEELLKMVLNNYLTE